MKIQDAKNSGKPGLVVVTGGNRGLGYEACQQLAKKGRHVLLTARDPKEGQEAADHLAREGLSVRFHQLDVADSQSIDRFVRDLQAEGAQVDALVNNAGIMIDDENGDTSVFKTNRDTLRRTMEINVYGPMELTLRLVPLMHGNSCVVNVSSGMGQLSDMGGGYPAYRVSKTSLNALTRIFAADLRGTGIKVNSVSPGWVRTRMGGEGAPLSPEQGVKTIVWLATLPKDGPTGGYFDEDQEPMDW